MRWMVVALGVACLAASAEVVVDDFARADSLYHGHGWESLNPGYWSLQDGALRRRLHNRGDKARATGFPYHYESHKQGAMPMAYDASLPFGMIWRRDWKLRGNYTIRVDATVRALADVPEGAADWKQYQPGYGLMGVCFGGETLFESWTGGGKPGDASWMALWRDDQTFGVFDHASDAPNAAQEGLVRETPALAPGDRVMFEVEVSGDDPATATVIARLKGNGWSVFAQTSGVDRARFTDGYFGLVARGLLDFEVNRVALEPGTNQSIDAPVNDLHVCYPLGDTLRLVDGHWHCDFVALFRSDGERAVVRVADSPNPKNSWASVPVAGEAQIISNEFRLNTAVIDVTLPEEPSEAVQYYTVWKDGSDVTGDPREGFLGKKEYVGRLPRLEAPYRMCGLGGHAINGGNPDLPRAERFQEYWVHDQPTPEAYRHLEDYDFQVMLWDDDVWYLELLIYPPSIDDAYKIITYTIAGPTSRWQMMRHWNVINPGDHDHGMDDVKGPEQYAIRQHADLGQDVEYMRRNFQIVSHLVQADEAPSGTDNPKRWRRWKMPDRDFSLLITDARLWRSSQDTHLWDDHGWGHKANVYDRRDPTRTLLGEEQFAWLQEMVRTDSSPLLCVTGINCLHPIWSGYKVDVETGLKFAQRDRVAADYAGWVTAGSERVIQLFGSRQGIVSVFGDIHLASIVENREQRFYECSFGPIGRSGSRKPKEDFGPEMEDYDGRGVRIHAAYRLDTATPDLQPNTGPKHWNFLELHFEPRGPDPAFGIQIRNVIDPTDETPRGGGSVRTTASKTGRATGSALPAITTLADADVFVTHVDGRPIRGTRSLDDGSLPRMGLVDVAPGTEVIVTATGGGDTESQLARTR
jgi:hypothetical protein